MRHIFQTALALVACSALVLATTATFAADTGNAGANDRAASNNANTFRASKLIGMSVRNDQNEKVGTVDDLVINMSNGQIAYAALGFGGILGFGEKLFAVPMNQMKIAHDSNDTYFVLHVTKDMLKAAPGFDKNHWPDFADPNWSKEVDNYYRQHQTTTKSTTTTTTSPNVKTSQPK